MNNEVKYDALYYGILAGIAGGIVQSIFTRPLVWFHVIDAGVFEHAKNIILGQNMRGYLPSFLGLFSHLLYSGLWGGAFALLINKYPGHQYFKGIAVGTLAFFVVMFITTLLGKQETGPEESFHAVFLIIGGALSGFVYAWAYEKLSGRFE